jgi:hypothetical protein
MKNEEYAPKPKESGTFIPDSQFDDPGREFSRRYLIGKLKDLDIEFTKIEIDNGQEQANTPSEEA